MSKQTNFQPSIKREKKPWRLSKFSDRSKKRKLVEDIEIMLPLRFTLIPIRGCRAEVENITANQRPDGFLACSIGPKHTLSRGHETCFLSCFVEFCSVVAEEKSKTSQPI